MAFSDGDASARLPLAAPDTALKTRSGTFAAALFSGQRRRLMRPVILVTSEVDVDGEPVADASRADYAHLLTQVGALPLVLPYQADRIADYLAMGDGVVIAGVRRNGPASAQAETFEQRLVVAAAAAAAELPLLGISEGMQVLGRHLGGQAAGGYRAIAHAEDGAVDAFEGNTRQLCLGVRWHMPHRPTALDQALIDRFVANCRQRAGSLRGAGATRQDA